MSHHHRKLYEEREPVETKPMETKTNDKPVFPLLEQNDINLLTMIKPLFSNNGQRIIEILTTVSSGDSQNPIPELLNLLSQLMPNGENNKMKEMFPLLINLLSNPEIKNIINPTMLTTFMSMLASKKEPSENETT